MSQRNPAGLVFSWRTSYGLIKVTGFPTTVRLLRP